MVQLWECRPTDGRMDGGTLPIPLSPWAKLCARLKKEKWKRRKLFTFSENPCLFPHWTCSLSSYKYLATEMWFTPDTNSISHESPISAQGSVTLLGFYWLDIHCPWNRRGQLLAFSNLAQPCYIEGLQCCHTNTFLQSYMVSRIFDLADWHYWNLHSP